MIVPGGGISLDGTRWVACRPGFFLPVRVLSRLFRRLFLEKLVAAHEPASFHMIVPGGGFSLNGERWVSCRPSFFLPVRVLSRLFRRLFLAKLAAAHAAGELQFFGNHAPLTDAKAVAAYLAPLRNSETWVRSDKLVPFATLPLCPPRADIERTSRYRRFGPKGDIARIFGRVAWSYAFLTARAKH